VGDSHRRESNGRAPRYAAAGHRVTSRWLQEATPSDGDCGGSLNPRTAGLICEAARPSHRPAALRAPHPSAHCNGRTIHSCARCTHLPRQRRTATRPGLAQDSRLDIFRLLVEQRAGGAAGGRHCRKAGCRQLNTLLPLERTRARQGRYVAPGRPFHLLLRQLSNHEWFDGVPD